MMNRMIRFCVLLAVCCALGRRSVPCRLCRALPACPATRQRHGPPQQPRSSGIHDAPRTGGRRCRERRGRLRDRGVRAAGVDEISTPSRQYGARWLPGHCFGQIEKRPALLGDGNRRRRRICRPGFFHRSQRTIKRAAARPPFWFHVRDRSAARLRECLPDAVEARLLLVAERRIEAVERGLHRVGRLDHRLQALSPSPPAGRAG